MGVSIAEVLENQILSSQVINMIPSRCSCGEEIKFTDDIRSIECNAKGCNNKLVSRIENFSNLTQLNMSKEDIVIMLKKLPRVISPYQVLDLGQAYKQKKISKSVIIGLPDVLKRLDEIKRKSYYVYEIGQLCGIESITKIAKKLFYGFNTVTEFYDNFDKHGVNFISEKLGINSTSILQLGIQVINDIEALRDELQYAETKFSIRKHERVLRVAFSDNEITPYTNRGELIETLNYKFNSEFIIVSNIDTNTDILIKNKSGKTKRYIEAVRINERLTAECVNSGKFKYKDIGTDKQRKGKDRTDGADNENAALSISDYDKDTFKPLGQSIYIGSVEEVTDRLRKFNM